jgi:D-amino-acid dehydrogenase
VNATDEHTSPREIVVVGAGVIGVCCARWLQRDGHRVRLIDAEPPGRGCSWGNAGMIEVDSVIPLATPRLLWSLPRMLADPLGPLVVRWSYLPRMLPWLTRFLLNARPARFRANMHALADLCGQAKDGYRPLIEGRPAGECIRESGWVTAYETARAFDAARWDLEQKERFGVRAQWLGAGRLRERVPQLTEHVVGGLEFPDAWMVTDPGEFVARLAADVEADGGRIDQARVTALRATDTGVRIETDAGSVDAEHCVVATGAHTRALARSLGDDFPLDTERGYHAMLPSLEGGPPLPVFSGEYKFVTTPMTGGIRLAGTAELAGLERAPDPRRVRILVERGARLFPALQTTGYTEWMGFRPTLPDSLPVIGRSPRCAAVTYAFGHQHLGLTLGGITGRLVADEFAGRAAPIDTAPTRPTRF